MTETNSSAFAGAPGQSPAKPKQEEQKQEGGTLFQMMSSGKANPYGAMAGKSIKEKRIEFELNQSNI